MRKVLMILCSMYFFSISGIVLSSLADPDLSLIDLFNSTGREELLEKKGEEIGTHIADALFGTIMKELKIGQPRDHVVWRYDVDLDLAEQLKNVYDKY